MSVKPPNPPYVGPPKWSGDNNNKPINRVVIHCTAGAEPGAANAARNTVNYSKNTSRPSSFHYVTDSKTTLQYCYDSYVAYHAPPNQHSIGWEICCSLSNEGRYHFDRADHKAALKQTAEGVARLCLAYNVPIVKLTASQLKAGKRGICGHADVRDAWHQTSHWDPGPYFPWKQFIALVKECAKDLQEPDKPSRGAAIDHALKDLELAAKRANKRPARLRKIEVAVKSLLKIKAG